MRAREAVRRERERAKFGVFRGKKIEIGSHHEREKRVSKYTSRSWGKNESAGEYKRGLGHFNIG
jgi:hypothetical protein